MDTKEKKLCVTYIKSQTHNIWERSYSSCHWPFQTESNFKKDYFCFFANNSLKANLFSSYNGPILQHGKTSHTPKEEAKWNTCQCFRISPSSTPSTFKTQYTLQEKMHAKRRDKRTKAHFSKYEILWNTAFTQTIL